jgi:sugar-specific transcriptional regulator TrmB
MIETKEISSEELEMFGLSSYEAKAYLALLPGVKSAKEIVRDSNIPTGRIYDILNSLEDKGLTEKQDSRPKKFIAKHPKIALKNLIAKKEEYFHLLVERATKLEEKLSQLKRPKAEEKLFWSIALFSEENAFQRLMEKINEAETELLMCVDMQCAGINSNQTEIEDPNRIVKSLIDRGVKIKILVGGFNNKALTKLYDSSLKQYLPLLSKLEVKITQASVYNFDLIDKEKIILKISNPINPDEYLALLFFWQKKLAIQLREKFLELWNNAKELNFTINQS